MSYVGTTSTGTAPNPPVNLNRGMGQITSTAGDVLGSSQSTAGSQSPVNIRGGSGLWYYCSSDGSTVTMGTGYFSDGLQLGMRNGDAIIVVAQSSLGTSPTCMIGVLMSSNSTAGFNVAVGGAIQSS